MPVMRRRLVVVVAGLGVAGLTVTLSGSPADANREPARWASVPAVVDARGVTAPNVLSPGLTEFPVAQGSIKAENPIGDVQYYGYHANGTFLPNPTVVQAPGVNVEASKTEPDKNTYLRLH